MPTDIDTVKGNVIENNLGTIIQNIISAPKNEIETQIIYNLVGFGSKVYGRDEEAKILGDALCGNGEFAAKQFCLIVAPSGFGKSYLLSKTLRKVTNGAAIYPAYTQTVQRIIRLDCRNTKSVSDIVSQFTNIIGLSFAYPADFGFPFEYFNEVLFHYLRKVGKIWLILDNFESWLDGENDYQPVNQEVEAFLNALFEGNHTLRGVFLSQSPPVNFIRQKLKTLETIGESLYKGLPRKDALLMLKEGEGVDFSDVPDELIDEFLEKVAYIPQAINSLLGYMQDGITLYDVLHIPEFQKGFEEYESDAKRVEAGERRTNALIARQIKAQSADIQLLLQALAYFARPLPYEALEFLFDDKLKARNAINRLKTHRLASETKDITGTNYYDLHAYFRRQTKKVLPDLSRIVNAGYADALLYERAEKNRIKGFLQKAFDLCECAEKIYQELFDKGQTDLENRLASAKNNKGVAFRSQGKLDESITNYDEAIKIRERLVNELKQDHLANDLAMVYMNKGITLYYQGKLDESITNYDEARKIRERLVNELKQNHFANDLALVYINKVSVLYSQGKLDESIINCDEAIKIYERLVNELEQDQFVGNLALVYMNKGGVLYSQGKLNESITNYDEAIKIYERLFDELKQDQFANDLATVYMNKGNSLDYQGKLDEAIENYDKSEKARECWLERGHYQVLPEFMKNIRNRVDTLLKLEDWRRVANEFMTAFDFVGRWRGVELSDYFQEQIKEHRDKIISLLRQVSAKNRKEIYKYAGEFGEQIKQLVEDFEEDEKKS